MQQGLILRARRGAVNTCSVAQFWNPCKEGIAAAFQNVALALVVKAQKLHGTVSAELCWSVYLLLPSLLAQA